ncbi:CehA/McbA family metallohydrolase [Chitinispirillales bacterium ANBcel5]|uniref:CehA/McbA family metallohydrolase n=1 Tax=Cellulosispirillum alkaliphilum TaxID=3039283 RepID=UPI002A50F613|nr:CehA/McbA family metallohydrolase [Chitinispirillales bacterium ANBcel5]
MIFNDITDIVPLLLYSEIHFRFFKGFPSLLFKKEPEIIFDMPRRIMHGRSLPLVLILNDCDQYPIKISQVSVRVWWHNTPPTVYSFSDSQLKQYTYKHSLNNYSKIWYILLEVDFPPDTEIHLTASLEFKEGNGKKGSCVNKIIYNDNLPTSSKKPFRCYIASSSYPGQKFCSYGDLHSHSLYSRSHVEFGPPIGILDKVAAASGLDFLAITDHSYDLACNKDNYLKQDPSLSLWKLYQEEIQSHTFSTIIVPGEEISCLNSQNKVVHLCALNVKEYIPGTLDGARANTIFKKQLTVDEAVGQVQSQGGIAFAAHPGARSGLLQRLLLKRGDWSSNDLAKTQGIQAANGSFKKSWNRGKSLWVKLLQEGMRIPILAGNDAHGDFNRYRAIEKPFISVHEDFERYLGFVRTGIYDKCSNLKQLLSAIKKGKTFVTNGPFVCLSSTASEKDSVISTSPLKKVPPKLHIVASSTKEFGMIKQVKVLSGQTGSPNETTVFFRDYKHDCYMAREHFSTSDLPLNCYLRVEVKGATHNGHPVAAFTSACFIQKCP